MDPNAALRDFLEACRDCDHERASSAFWALHAWVRRGGFAPTLKEALR